MLKDNKKKFKREKEKDTAKEELKDLEELPLVGGLFKGLGKFIDLVEKVEEAGGEISARGGSAFGGKKQGEIKGTGKDGPKGIYGFSIRTGIGDLPRVQTFGNIRPVKKKAGKAEVKVAETREPIVDVFDEKNYVLIIAELPGIDEKSIKLELKKDILILEAGSQERKYAKEILLPCPTCSRKRGGRAAKIDFASRKVNFKNGILKIKFKKK